MSELAFPHPQPVERIFRDGKRAVPEHVAAILGDMETDHLLYEEAILMANKRLEADLLNERQADIIAAHFKERL
jgi:hypothetical protein